MTKFFKSLMVEEDGATMVEYALMVALIAAALVTTVKALSTTISGQFGALSTSLGG